MNRTPVSSDNLMSVGYEPSSMTLEIEFKSGRIYQYFDVPETVYQELMTAPSHGKFFNAYIRSVYRSAQA